ncbi:MAG TPA: SDR family oxidoreductase [Rhizomicrobium sp.]|jgi:short-subunit dehydrogenase
MKTPERKHAVVIITGASAGVGRAVAQRFAQSGAKLGLIARDEEALQEMRRDLAGAESFAYRPIDVSRAEEVFAAAEEFEKDLGPIDIWINDAMVTVFSPLREMSPEEFRRVTEVTYLGFVHGCMAALKYMRPRNRGHIINIGSALAYRGIPLQSAYCGAKHAIRGFTAALRTELAHEKSAVALTMVQLPAMNTPQFAWARTHMPDEPRPMGTIYQPEAAADAVFRAARTRPKEYWVGLSTFLTIVGNMVAPAFMDRFLARTAVEGQETRTPVAPTRKDNLFAPVMPLHRTHGSFGKEAKRRAFFADGQVLRAALIMAGAALFFVLGRLIP